MEERKGAGVMGRRGVEERMEKGADVLSPKMEEAKVAVPVSREEGPVEKKAGGVSVWGWAGIGLVVLICLIGIVIALIGRNWLLGRNTNKVPEGVTPTSESVAIAFTNTIAPSGVPVQQTPATQQIPVTQNPTATITSPILIPSQTPSPKPTTEPASCTLSNCDTSTESVCIYSFAPQSSSLLLALKFKQPVSSDDVPFLLVSGVSFACAPLASYPDRLYCTGPSTSGNAFLQLMSAENESICSGSIDIPKYVTPVPTPKNTDVPSGNYP